MKSFLATCCLLFAVCAYAQAPNAGTNQIQANLDQAKQTAKRQQAEQQYEIAMSAQAEQNQAAQKKIQTKIDGLKSDIQKMTEDLVRKQRETDWANQNIETLRQHLLDQKKTIPKDPWREIGGETKFLSVNSGYVIFSGQIQEVTQNGIRVLGRHGNTPQEEYFVLNFPYHFDAGESIDPEKELVAFENGKFSYITEDGYAKTITKLNYGKPCARPANADSVELAAQQLNSSDMEQITNAVKNATTKQAELDIVKNALDAAQSSFQYFLKTNQDMALKNNQEQADKDDPAALRRMGERYRDGDGVVTNLATAAEYFKKADEAREVMVRKIIAENDAKEQAAKVQKFNVNLILADKGQLVSMIFVGMCYRDGEGVEKNLDKAREYFRKASDMGSTEASQLYYDCK